MNIDRNAVDGSSESEPEPGLYEPLLVGELEQAVDPRGQGLKNETDSWPMDDHSDRLEADMEQ
jgi:hypothetical protein